jgi:hypothetical protein
MLNPIAIILISLLLFLNWGETSPQLNIYDGIVSSEKSLAQIHCFQNQDKMLVIEGTFYNGSDKEININYKLNAVKSGQSNNSSNQSGNFKVSSQKKVILSKITMDLNKADFYKIKLKIFKTNQLIAEDSVSFFGDKLTQN